MMLKTEKDVWSIILRWFVCTYTLTEVALLAAAYVCMWGEGGKERQTDRQRQRDRDRQTDRQTERERETDRQTDKETVRER